MYLAIEGLFPVVSIIVVISFFVVLNLIFC